MADIPAANILHEMKETEKNAHDEKSSHHEVASTNGNEKSEKDIERTASHGAGYDLSHLPVDDDGEYVVTMKTWAVVVVSSIHSTVLSSS